MKTTLGNNSITEENFRQAFLSLRPRLNYVGNNLNIQFKSNEYQIPLTVHTGNKVGYVR